MADTIGIAEGGLPNLNLSAEERRVYGHLFKEADPDSFGAVSGDVAVKFFEKTRLPADVLGQIWQIADTENRGFLTPAGFGIVLRLIGHAQAGEAPSLSIVSRPAPLPRFEGMSVPGASIPTQTTGTPSSPTSANTPIRVPALGPEKVAEYSSLFEKSGAENGMLSGLVAKQIFERAKLPNEVLGRIWALADTQGRGSLDTTEFVIAMHLLASYKSGALRGVPSTLPPGLYDAAARRPPPRLGGPLRPASASGPPPVMYAQNTGFNQRPQSPITRQQAGSPLSGQVTGDWLITPADKARFDQVFASVDRQGLGYIDGEAAVEFFGNARLPEEVLAQIWDLSDTNSSGQLDKDEFAVAMYLIRQQRGSRDGRGVLPSTLPPALIPPSKRKLPITPSQPTAPAFENAPITQPRSAAEDLFGLDVLAPTQPTTAPTVPATAPAVAGLFDNVQPAAPSANVVPAGISNTAASTFKPFEPSSTFGRSLAPQPTGSPAPNQNRAVKPVVADNEDLLGDADPTVSSRLTNETSELGNLSNQVGNLSKQMTELQGNRAQAEQEVSQINHQKRAFEGRLAQLRSAYEKAVAEYTALQNELTATRNENKRLQQDIATVEASHAQLSSQYQQSRAQFENDQRENAALKEKIRQFNVEIEQLRPQNEKLKGDARQQKGLVAINKKQLATNEAERDRLIAEMNASQKEMEEARKEAEETARQLELSRAEIEKAKELPPPPVAPIARSPAPIQSPAASVGSNPFMRRTGTGVSDVAFSPPAASPEPVQDKHSAFDNIFGPSFGPGQAAATAPTTSFRSETPPVPVRNLDVDGSVTPSVIEPPEPPPSKQITSDALPLRSSLIRAESVGSSVQVAPPASRLSPADTPRAFTPTTASSAADDRPTVNDPFEYSAQDEEQNSVRQAVEAATPSVAIPGAFPSAETPRSATPADNFGGTRNVGSGAETAAIAVAAGATAVAGAGAAAAFTDSNETKTENEPKTASNFDEYFGGPAHQRTHSEQVKDFDDAFASMKLPPVSANTGNTTTNEFPDIQELDDDSSSSDEEAPLGFDDDFSAKPGPSAVTASNAAGKQPEAAPTTPGHLEVRPQLESTSTASSLPKFEPQTSPPTYNDSVPEDNPSHFPREYKGLLPEREDPTSPTPTAGGSSQPPAPPAGSPPAYGPEVTRSQDEALSNVASQAAQSTTTTSKVAAFDFDSAFSGMGPAQVEDDDSDDGDTTFGSSRDRVAEFDPSFDSPAQSRAATVASNTNSPAVRHTATNGTSSTNNVSATDSFYNFGTSATPAEVVAPKTTSAPITHDFDALFAPLSSSTGLDTTVPPAATASTTIPAPQNASTSSLKPERPAPGRALSTGTEHDDPILKSLTSMGWSRADSLAALEKFDYNIDKAADYLTFRS